MMRAITARISLLVCAAGLFGGGNAHAITMVVNKTGDQSAVNASVACDVDAATPGDQCTLRAAVQRAEVLAGDDEIRFNIPTSEPNCDPGTGACTINVADTLQLSGNVSIFGPGADRLTVRRSDFVVYRVVTVISTGTVRVSDLTIRDGDAGSSAGAGILNASIGTLHVSGCSIIVNRAGSGAGLANTSGGTLNVTNSVIGYNTATGVEDCRGGGISNNTSGTINVTNCLVWNNVASYVTNFVQAGTGGGFFNGTGQLNISNCTITGNGSQNAGNGISGPATVQSTVIAQNGNSGDLFGNYSSAGFNLIGNASGSTGFTHPTDQVGTSGARLNPGFEPVDTMLFGIMVPGMPACGSLLVDKATSDALSTDIRGTGFPRTLDDPGTANAAGGNGTDIGAFERPFCPHQQLTFVVNTTGNEDDVSPGDGACDTNAGVPGAQCTLLAAIRESNALGSDRAQTINFSIPTSDPGYNPGTGRYTIDLNGALPLIKVNLIINGSGAGKLTVRRNSGGAYSVFDTEASTPIFNALTLSGLTINNGLSPTSGGGIHYNGPGVLSVSDCVFTDNFATNSGGGISAGTTFSATTANVTNCTFNQNLTPMNNTTSVGGGINVGGTLSLTNSRFSGNGSGGGGGVAVAGQVNVTNSTFIGNSAMFGSGGAGLYLTAFSTTSAISNSTFSNNTDSANGSGGGIRHDGFSDTLNVVNCTFSGNAGNGGGGAIYHNGGTLNVSNSTLAGNSAGGFGGGLRIEAGTVHVKSSIIALNTSGVADVSGVVISDGFNLIGTTDGSSGFTLPTDQTGTNAAPLDPRLDPAGLKSNGGPTFTIALQADSTAIDRGSSNGLTGPLPVDQRGYVRQNTADVGAFERGATIPVTLANISTRLGVQTGDNVLIGGFIVTGTQPKRIIVRAIGPSLSSFFPGALADPILELRDSSGGLIRSNDNWRSDQEAEIISTGIPPSDDLESAIVATLPANSSAYTAIVRGVNNGIGIGGVEAYDLDQTVDSKLANISTRGFVQTGDNVLIGGLIVLGQNSLRVIVRAIGPSLPAPGALADPTLELHDGNGVVIASNDDWRTNQETEIIVTGIPPTNDLESAIVRDLAPGNYTAIVRGVNNTTGIAVVEAYGLN